MADTPGSAASRTLAGEHEHETPYEHETPFEHLAIQRVNSVHEIVDARLSLDSRPSPRELEESFSQIVVRALSIELERSHDQHRKQSKEQQSKEPQSKEPQGDDNLKKEKDASAAINTRSTESEEILYVDWEERDPRNPENYSRARKWAITIVASGLTGLVAAAASTYSIGSASMIRDLNCTQLQASVGLSVYALGFAVVPLVLAPLSEELGRQPLYVVTTFILLLSHIGVALAKNIQTVIVLRFIAGAAGSTGSTMVGGTVADIWAPHERGLPMAVFSIAAVSSTGTGPVFAGWIEMNRHLEWRWIQWIHLMVTGVMFVAVVLIMKETRSSVLLTRLARKIRKETGDNRYRARIEDERGSLRSLILVSCTRPVHLLVTEPVVTSFSLWAGFAWGILYVFLESIAPAFEQLHHFNIGEVGTVYVTILIGSVFGYFTNVFYQEKIYAKKFESRGHEARLYSSCAAGVLFPASMFIYAWTSLAHVHWIAMCIAITLCIWSIFMIYLAVFTYLADCYGPFASSALAGQSLSRNLAATIFPLFTIQMYNALTFKWANTLFACLALLMMPIPFILFRWGPQIRARSKFASKVPAFGS
ncbi:MFS general substrate transporter [Fomitiporia mediterranea MF3/22]|uniref:MFS general substrate transporter n=1 Tax=Fomitiporia mediterranea (strain MF3/22) TaxID=694068 RepID=UPI00044075B6|nr:MFS general substrate transporter [Fomitiporia mediterranea MF3/22]EJD07445.1 MFS general substrate transporter [Fomitiporia mediterranea MF3/22]